MVTEVIVQVSTKKRSFLRDIARGIFNLGKTVTIITLIGLLFLLVTL